MKVFRDLEISGSASSLMKLIETIESKLENGWTRDREAEKRLEETGSRGEKWFCFSCTEKEGREAAKLWFTFKGENTLYVSNIVPVEFGKLTYDQYNTILKDFHSKFIEPVGQPLGLKYILTSDVKDIEDWVSDETAKKLRRFSAAANRGLLHPLDRERWFDFLVSAHKESSELDETTLMRWLIEHEKWSEEVASELAEEYENARALLKFYDKAR